MNIKSVKKLFTAIAFLSLTMALNSNNVGAAETGENVITNNNKTSGYFEINYSEEDSNAITPQIIQLLNSGETEKELGILEDGSILSVEVTNNSVDRSRATNSASKTFQYTTTNIFGIKKNAYKVEVTVVYTPSKTSPTYVAGTITQMRGTYTIQDSSFSCYWDNSSAENTQILHQIILKSFRGSNYSETWFCALLGYESGVEIYTIDM